jgi:hypothetical protein
LPQTFLRIPRLIRGKFHMQSVPTIIKIAVLALLGMCAAFGALWLESNRYAVPNWGYVTAALMCCFFVLMTWALFLLLALRDRRNATLTPPQFPQTAAPPFMSMEAQELTVYTLQPGVCYEVKQAFSDHYGNQFEVGERLTFQQRHFLPYHGGHTIVFTEKTMYLQEEVNRVILDDFSRYLGVCDC